MISQSTDSSDPLGVLLKLAGAYKLGRLWRVPQIPGGFVATGLDQVTDGERQAWMAAPTRLTTVQVEDLLGCGLAQESEFRDIPFLAGRVVPAVQRRLHPRSMSPDRLVLQAKFLALRGQQLRKLATAREVATQMAAVLGREIPHSLLPEWEQVEVLDWAAGSGVLASHRGILTTSEWETLPDTIRNGSPDGIRLRCDGDVVRVAAAAQAASFFIELRRTDPEEASIPDLVAQTFWHRPRGVVTMRLSAASKGDDERRLFHVERTLAGGARVLVFDPWTETMVEHGRLTHLWQLALEDKTDDAARRLRTAVWEYGVDAPSACARV